MCCQMLPKALFEGNHTLLHSAQPNSAGKLSLHFTEHLLEVKIKATKHKVRKMPIKIQHLNFSVWILIISHSFLAVASIIDRDVPQDSNLDRRQTIGECFEEAADEEELEANIKEIFQDSAVTECYTGLQKEEIYKCLTGNMLMMEESYKNVTAEFCPTWSKSKQCLFRYLNSRCNDREVGLIEKSAAFNSELALPSLMCEPGWTVHLRGILKQSREFGLWDCFTNSTEFLPRFQKCTLGSRYIMNGMFPEYTKGIHKFARCIKTALNTCAKGDRVKVLQLKSIWSQIEDTFESSYGLFWEQYKNQS